MNNLSVFKSQFTCMQWFWCFSHNIADVIGSTNESLTLWVEDVQQPLYRAMEQFCKGVHHALVYNSQDKSAPLKYLSQTDIAAFLLSHTTLLPHLQTLLALPTQHFCTHPVVTVQLTTLLSEAIKLLVLHSALEVHYVAPRA